MRKLYTFHGGIHPAEHKSESSESPSVQAPIPSVLVLPLQQHLGRRAKALVREGDTVLKGQLIAQADGMLSAAIHAPTSGTVVSAGLHGVPHPSGLQEQSIVIQPDGKDQWIAHAGIDYRALPKSALLTLLREGGIVGLGGATFPTHVKFTAGPAQHIETLVVNGAECEPWITTDDRLMRERTSEIVQGIEILRHLIEPTEILIGIEDNKPQAAAAMRAACEGSNMEVVVIPTLYPSGGEKQLIRILTGKEVPSGGLPLNIGVVCCNVATAYSVNRLVHHGEPMISRMLTVTGNVKTPQNFEVLLGTPIAELLRLAGGTLPDSSGYILGGPMMGLHVFDEQLPVVKGTNCIIVKSAQHFPAPPPALPCIRCTRCAQACPADLQPQELYWFAKAKNFDKARAYNLFDCIECGTCAYVCPSHIPLVQYYRFAKSEISAQDKDQAAAAAARERHEFRMERIERDKREKAEKLAQKEKAAAQASQQTDSASDAAQAQIQAALARVHAQPAAQPKNTEQLTAAQQAQIDEAEARRAQAHELAQTENERPKE